ncbi:putative damage-inducible protein DinB [Nocardiopsis mwathae]|uniref:Putative damage-inducible protein DinB n=1 Tax=Nocardiopsis mwathae TaxID=1472723 RepID=A0A7X0D7U1_9ACTN|nr:DinB family protein [Nocardiopsis mwathae]MBB6174096.1 putative damage-inducible protein DinB [Nocardiopsis mwathae]
MTESAERAPDERDEVLSILAEQRKTLRMTIRGLDDTQATARTTVSALCLAGLIKHVARVERGWIDIMTGRPARDDGPSVGTDADEQAAAWADEFRLLDGETLQGMLDLYDEVARETEKAVAALPGLDVTAELPRAPWFPPDTRWTARRILLHLIRETAQHAGHADIIREALDGATTSDAWLEEFTG